MSILERARAATWFRSMGEPAPAVAGVVRMTLEAWTSYISAPSDTSFAIDWLSEDGPNNLLHPLTNDVRTQRLAVSKVILAATRSLPASPWFVIDRHDLREPARKMAAHSFRMAIVEEAYSSPGFWRDVVGWFEHGFWPVGLRDDSQLVVL